MCFPNSLNYFGYLDCSCRTFTEPTTHNALHPSIDQLHSKSRTNTLIPIPLAYWLGATAQTSVWHLNPTGVIWSSNWHLTKLRIFFPVCISNNNQSTTTINTVPAGYKNIKGRMVCGMLHGRGTADKTGVFRLKKGERVFSSAQLKKEALKGKPCKKTKKCAGGNGTNCTCKH